MGVIDGLQRTDWARVLWTLLILVPVIDKEVFASIPGLRAITPGVEPFYWLDLSWTERARLVALIAVPYVDGEILELGGVDMHVWVED